MFREMAEAGNPTPEYKQVEFMVKVKLTSALREENVEKSREKTTQKSSQKTAQKKEKWPDNDQKSREKSREKIIVMMKECPGITQSKLAESLQISVKAVEKQIRSLRERGIIRRVGPDKGGHWEVIEQEDNKQ